VRALAADQWPAIYAWPLYGAPFEALNYAIRRGGWLDEQARVPGCIALGGWMEDELVAFSLLVPDEAQGAEYFVAVKSSIVQKGIGRQMTGATLRHGFVTSGLARIFLKVRVNHAVGRHLYASVGFSECGFKTEETNGVPVDFVLMEMTREQWLARASTAR
jgi:RimJ/RimL family protein N-acetyltransferase